MKNPKNFSVVNSSFFVGAFKDATSRKTGITIHTMDNGDCDKKEAINLHYIAGLTAER